MNFPVQACSTCGEQTENLFCPNCRKKLTREQVKVFWNAQSWAQYRATVLDFQSFSTSLPYLETRVLDSAPVEEVPAGRKMGALVGLVAVGLVAAVALALWFTRANDPKPTNGTEVALETGPDGKPKKAGLVKDLKTRTPRPSALAGAGRPVPGRTAPAGVTSSASIPAYDPSIEEVCGKGTTSPQASEEIVDVDTEELCGLVQPTTVPIAPSKEDVSGYVAPESHDTSSDLEAEDISQNSTKDQPEP